MGWGIFKKVSSTGFAIAYGLKSMIVALLWAWVCDNPSFSEHIQ